MLQTSDINNQSVSSPRLPITLSPKRPRTEIGDASNVLSYYAGYSFEWAVGNLASLSEESMVLDPWNGSGTTTLAASRLGIRAVGLDMNPVAGIVAKARSCTAPPRTSRPSPPLCTREPSSRASRSPLAAWFTEASASRLEDWARSATSLNSSINAILLVSIFRTIRSLTKVFEGSNPTWVKQAKTDAERLTISSEDIDDMVLTEWDSVVALLPTEPTTTVPLLLTADAGRMPLSDASVDAVIGSPPYLTRIDYGVAYSREIAALGISPASKLRLKLMGTTKIRDRNLTAAFHSHDIQDVINSISGHQSKDSNGYYRKQAIQYFLDLIAALREISRVTRPGGQAKLVVQDSYYKEVHIPLAHICSTLMVDLGWSLDAIESYEVPRLLTTMNPGARTYPKGSVSEAVVHMRRRDG